MKLVIQRTLKAAVEVTEKIVAEIGPGLLILVGIAQGDDQAVVKKMAQKILKLRIFADDHRDINRSVEDIKGQILAVSQFTLLADTSAGNRPSFIKAAEPKMAKKLFDLFVLALQKSDLNISTGVFGHYMKVSLVNDGPVTIIYQ